MKRKDLIWIIILFSVVLGAGLILWRSYSSVDPSIPSMVVESQPLGIDVWLDGNRVGNTPYTVRISDADTHNLELRSERFWPVIYTFDSSSMPTLLHVQMFPWQVAYPPDPRNWLGGQITSDWNWIIQYDQGWKLINVQDPVQARNIGGDTPVVSPDGKWVLCIDQRWLVDVESGNHTDVFSDYPFQNNDSTRVGFSPDSRWFYILQMDYVDNDYVLNIAISSVGDPQTIALFTDGLFPVWSPDSNWLAIPDRNYLIHIYQLADGIWQPYSSAFQGLPMGWSSDGTLLWTGYWSGLDIFRPITLHNVTNSETITTWEEAVMTTAIESLGRNMFAFTSARREQEVFDMVITNNEGTVIEILSDHNYKRALYWLNNDHQLAVWVQDENSHTSSVIMIIDVPTINR